MKYRKKPIVIDAIKWDGGNVLEFIDSFPESRHMIQIETADEITIKTLEGNMTLMRGDYLIRGIKGEYYPCKADIFEMSYEPVFENNEVNLRLFRKDYLFSKSPHGDGINITIDGVKVLLPTHLIVSLLA